MKNLSLRSDFYIPSCSFSNPPLFVKPIKVVLSHGKKDVKLRNPPPSKFAIRLTEKTTTNPVKLQVPEKGYSRRDVIVGAVSVVVLLINGGIDDHKALALGPPEGPLVEEFWDNVRRYALYALTVSTGAIYTIVQPIFELLKNPISAILIIAILGGSIYIVSQVLSAMVGVTDFTYNYG